MLSISIRMKLFRNLFNNIAKARPNGLIARMRRNRQQANGGSGNGLSNKPGISNNSRPGQESKPPSNPENKPESNKPEQEWDKDPNTKPPEKIKSLAELKSNSKLYKKFEPDAKAEDKKASSIASIDKALEKGDQAILAGVIDNALDSMLAKQPNLDDEKKDKFKLEALGFPKSDNMITIGKTETEGKYDLFRGDSKTGFATLAVNDNGALAFQKS